MNPISEPDGVLLIYSVSCKYLAIDLVWIRIRVFRFVLSIAESNPSEILLFNVLGDKPVIIVASVNVTTGLSSQFTI